ncbi:PQQ-binding-like beta-propeller repeat protein [uncultured Lutibacter sp.]|uniref:PQQ-binding-like beta-propeller repeat protein n=1 Tax=uncultured Lutibacter sp. TaxID=437739 RepID=UPI0026156BE0|nr:PQQ-binding-like beta-propeller repeat protein [uncultured Lutibacter sp.]
MYLIVWKYKISNKNQLEFESEYGKGDVIWEFQTIGCKTDTLNFFNSSGEIDPEIRTELTKDISDMPTLSSLYRDVFINAGAILSSPVISNQVIYFGSSDGYIYAITDK